MRHPLWLAIAFGSALLAGCGGGGGGKTPTSPTPVGSPQVVVVTVQDNQFVPKQVNVNPGDTVRWVLSGSSNAGHTVTANDGSFDSGKVFTSSGAAYEHTFSQEGQTVLYHCQTHYVCCQMQGSVRVGSSAPPPPTGY
jgi:plastocyanin